MAYAPFLSDPKRIGSYQNAAHIAGLAHPCLSAPKAHYFCPDAEEKHHPQRPTGVGTRNLIKQIIIVLIFPRVVDDN